MAARGFSIESIPEFRATEDRQILVRIPGEMDVAMSPRIRKLVDSSPMRRLTRIRQLGLVSLVYPGACHSRFEHSLGVYRNALLFLRRLANDDCFFRFFEEEDITRLLVAALLHDVGHWPYCHPIEDLELDGIPRHESLARAVLDSDPVCSILGNDFGIAAGDIAELLGDGPADPKVLLARSVLSGPIDVDKLDYLYRDSLHCGVPYGAHFDRQRLIGSLCLQPDDCRLAITSKGCTAAELMVFARYVMFSEVYWHHAVRSATAMLQRAVYDLYEQIDWKKLLDSDDGGFEAEIVRAARGTDSAELVDAVFGSEGRLYKRIAQFNVLDDAETFELVSRRPYRWLVHASRQLGVALSKKLGMPVGPNDVLIDAPPPGLEIQFRIPVRYPGNGGFRWLNEVSPVVRTLADEQFDKYVKRVRVFANPRIAAGARKGFDVANELGAIARELGAIKT